MQENQQDPKPHDLSIWHVEKIIYMISQNEGKKAENSSKYCWDSTQMSTYGMTPLIGTSRKAKLISDRVRISGYLCKGEGTF